MSGLLGRLKFDLRTLLQSAGLALLCFPLGVAVASLSGIGHRWIDILAQFPAPALTATVVLGLALAAARLWVAAGASGAVCALLVVAVWPQAAPGGPLAEDDGARVRLYAANLHALNEDVDAIRASIEDADADILVMVEFGAAPTAAMDELLAGYPYRRITDRVVRSHDAVRSVIASRHPLTPRSTDGMERQMVAAVIDTPLGPVHVVGVHLTRPWPFQFQWAQIIQTQRLIDYISQIEEPIVTAGDFNSVSTARIGRMLRAEGDLVPASGWPGTWPSSLPGALRMTIDQVYHSPDIAVTSRRIGRPTGSDHRPVIVELARAAP